MEQGLLHRSYRSSYSASSGLSQTVAKEDSDIVAATCTNNRSSLCARKSTKSATSAILSGGSDLIFSSSSLSCIPLQPANQQLAFINHLWRQPIVQIEK